MTERKTNCAQTVLAVFAQDLGLDPVTALKVAAAFGGGMGRTGNTCGAVTAAYMAIGLARPLDPADPRASLDDTYALVHRFNQKFIARHGSLLCRELLGHDLGTEEGRAAAKEKDLASSICSNLIAGSAAILEPLLELSGRSPRSTR